MVGFRLKVLILCISQYVMKEITSPNNTFIKSLLVLRDKSKERRSSGKFIFEGIRELKLAVTAGYHIDSLLSCNEICEPETQKELLEINAREYIQISLPVFKKLALRASTEGVIVVAQAKPHHLDQLKFKTKSPLILVAEAPEKPGNIGAILRTADAAKVDAVLIANSKTDVYNPNIIRSSVGCLFTNTMGLGSTQEIVDFLKQHNIAIYSAILQDATAYTSQDYTGPSAIVVGTEDQGLSATWRDQATACIKIPMGGAIDSMNVSVAAGILVFEAVRQRNAN